MAEAKINLNDLAAVRRALAGDPEGLAAFQRLFAAAYALPPKFWDKSLRLLRHWQRHGIIP